MSVPRYQWRKLTRAERAAVFKHRQTVGRPWHAPPHAASYGPGRFHLTAACYEHRAIIGRSFARMDAFSRELVSTLGGSGCRTFAWCVLPNHYHALVEVPGLREVLNALGRLHGRSSFTWNGVDAARGRKVFFRAADRLMRSDRHFWATLNYIHHNPVHHGYVTRWTEWPWCSAPEYLEAVGREEAARVWKAFPVLDYGREWDDAEL